MATKQRSRSRRSSNSRDREPRYVAPVLDPNWQNPYAPSAAERTEHQRVIRSFAMKRTMATSVIAGVVVVALIVGVVVSPFLPIAGVIVGGLYGWYLSRTLRSFATRGQSFSGLVLAAFQAGGTSIDRQRLVTVLDRLAATFGVDGVSAFIVKDSTYNAALVPDGVKSSLFVTSALVQDFELIELEGVVSHCLARQRLGLLDREALASVLSLSDDVRQTLAGVGGCYRADEVAAASIRYPLGLAAALRRTARQTPQSDSFFASAKYNEWRWVFFNPRSDRVGDDLSDLDDPLLRARALEEW